MLKKYVTKFVVDILPSVAATVIGAYIVNHYIVTKPAANAPVAAAISTATPPKAEAMGAPEPAKADAKTEAKAETKTETKASPDAANLPAGVRARGISEKAVLERSAVEKPAEKPADRERSADKEKDKADRPAETASIPIETRRHQPAPREKPIAKAVHAPAQPAAPAVAPVAVAAPNPAPPSNPAPSVESANTPEERRDANDLARAAIDRLRGGNDGSPRAQEAARTPDASRIPDAPRSPDASSRIDASPRIPDAPRVVLAPTARPLPPPIMVSAPPAETIDAPAGPSQMRPPYAGSARVDDPHRPTPPAEIPASRPLDLRAEGSGPATRDHTSVAEDMLSAAKSVFHSVLPK